MPTDAELVAATLSGSQDAFRDLVVRFERPVYTLILRMVHDSTTAEDLAQEVFVKAYRHLATYDPARRFSSWLFKVAHNTTIDHLRRAALDTVPLSPAPASRADVHDEGGELLAVLADASTESPAAAAERHAMRRDLARAIASLRADYRAAVVLRYVEGQSYQEIAEALDLPLGTVKTNLHRARKEMAAAMAAAGWAPPEPRIAPAAAGGETAESNLP